MKGEGKKVIPLTLVLLFISICVPQVCFADTVYNIFSEEEKIGLNYSSRRMIVNITSGITTEQSSREYSKRWSIRIWVYDQYCNVTEDIDIRENGHEHTFYQQYIVDELRKMNETDRGVLWWIDMDGHRGDTVRILDDSFTVVGKGVQELRNSGAVRECWILVQENVVAYYDTEFGLLITLINITQVEGDIVKGTVLFFSGPATNNMEVIRSTPMAARFYTSFPPLIAFTFLVSVFVLTKYHISRKVRLWLNKVKQ